MTSCSAHTTLSTTTPVCQLTFFQNDKSTSDGTSFSSASLNIVGRGMVQIDNAFPRHISLTIMVIIKTDTASVAWIRLGLDLGTKRTTKALSVYIAISISQEAFPFSCFSIRRCRIQRVEATLNGENEKPWVEYIEREDSKSDHATIQDIEI